MSGCFNTGKFCNTTTTNNSWSHGGTQTGSVTGGLITIAVTTCAVNGLVFLLFLLKPQLRTAFNYFLLSLAISDFSAGLVVIPMGLMKGLLLANDSPEFDKHFAIVQATYHVLEKVIAFSTVFHVTAITIERYLAVVNPLKHHLLSESIALKFICAIWVVSFGTASIQFSWNLHEPENEEEDAKQYLHERNYYIFCIVTIFVVPYIIMLYAYCNMSRKIFARNKTERKGGALRRHGTIRRRSDRKALITFLSLAVTFALCWIPWFSITLYFLYGGILHPAAYMTSAIVRFITPISNPIIYTVCKRDFNDALRSFLKARVLPRRSSKRFETTSTISSKRQSSHRSRRGTLPVDIIPDVVVNYKQTDKGKTSITIGEIYNIPEDKHFDSDGKPSSSLNASTLKPEHLVFEV